MAVGTGSSERILKLIAGLAGLAFLMPSRMFDDVRDLPINSK